MYNRNSDIFMMAGGGSIKIVTPDIYIATS